MKNKYKLEKIKPKIKDNKLYKQIEELKEVLDKHVKELIELEFKNFELTGEMTLQNGGKLVRGEVIDTTKCPHYRPNDICEIYDKGIRECHKFPECMYRKWQRAEEKLKQLKCKECLYGGENCYKSMLDIITDESEE